MYTEIQKLIDDLCERGVANVRLKSMVFRPDLKKWVVVHDKANSGKNEPEYFNDLDAINRFVGPKQQNI